MDYITSILLISIFINLFLAFVILSKGIRNRINILFSLISICVTGWSLAIWGYYYVHTFDINWLAGTHTFALSISLVFYYFSFYFPKKIYESKLAIFLPGIVFLILSYLTTFTDWVFGLRNNLSYEINPGYIIYQAILIIFFTSAFFLLIMQYIRTKDEQNKEQIKYIFTGSLLSSMLAIITNLIFPFLGIFNFTWLGPIFTLILVISIFIAIAKYHLFNIKVIATETFVFLLWGFLLVRTLISEQIKDIVANSSLLIVTLFVGTFLIRSVIKEVTQREHIEKLAGDLSKANDQLKKANERLKELDKQKTEFVSIASHQLRSPLTAIKGYSSMLLEGSFGEISDKVREPLERIFQSSQKLVSVIEDFLNITRIELGRMKYEMSDFDLGKMTQQVIKEQEATITKKGVTISYEDDRQDHNIYADIGKVNQVINNVIDNASKYTDKGWIKVRVENITDDKGKEFTRISVKDSGTGIDKETLPKLFEKFVRAYDAGKSNIIGTGLGLYVAKQIVEGLGGRIWAESEGKGKGSTFFVEFKHSKPVEVQKKEENIREFVKEL